MLTVTKIFEFEMAHALEGYNGPCREIHGHSYRLEVSICLRRDPELPIASPGLIMDFKVLKALVQQAVLHDLDHALVLSEDFLRRYPDFPRTDNLRVWAFEPSAENMTGYIREKLSAALPAEIILQRVKLFETSMSFAEWIRDTEAQPR